MSEYGCNDLIPHDEMIFMNDGLIVNPLLYKVDPIQPEYTLTFRITVKSIQPDVWSAIILKGADKEQHRGPCIWLAPNSTKLYCRLSTVDNWDDGIGSTNKSLILKQEHHIVLVLSGNKEDRRLLLYIDGECDSTYNVNSKVLYREDMPFTLGGNEQFPCFNGILRRVRFYNYAMINEITVREDMMSPIPLIRDSKQLP